MSRQQRPRPGQNTFAFRGKPLKPLPALHQNQIELLFQIADAHRKRRLSDMAQRRGLAKMTRLIECDQVFELFNIHG